jgi:deazaflavin-dependent oxidoreductase (nitroreductase family)
MEMALGDFRNALNGTNEVEITTTGRNSGRTVSNPVWFVQDDRNLYLLPVGGSASQWYRNLRKTPTIHVEAAGTAWDGRAAPITDASRINDVYNMFSNKYGAGEAQRYYSNEDVAVQIPLA